MKVQLPQTGAPPAPHSSPGVRDAAWFTVLVGTYRHRVYAYLLKRGQTTADAEDMTQEVFLAAWVHRLRLLEDPLPWLLTVAHNKNINKWRAGQRLTLAVTPIEELNLPAADLFGPAAARLHVEEVLATLKPDQADLLRQVYLDDIPIPELAVAHGITRQAVSARLHRLCQAAARTTHRPPRA